MYFQRHSYKNICHPNNKNLQLDKTKVNSLEKILSDVIIKQKMHLNTISQSQIPLKNIGIIYPSLKDHIQASNLNDSKFRISSKCQESHEEKQRVSKDVKIMNVIHGLESQIQGNFQKIQLNRERKTVIKQGHNEASLLHKAIQGIISNKINAKSSCINYQNESSKKLYNFTGLENYDFSVQLIS